MKFFVCFCFTLFSQLVLAQASLVSQLEIEGNKNLKTDFIQKITKQKQNAVLDSLLNEEDIQRLKQLPSVSHATYQVKLEKGTNNYKVIYSIKENFTIIPSVNVYTSIDD